MYSRSIRKRRSRGHCRSAKRFVPRFEALEDRRLLAMVHVVDTTSDSVDSSDGVLSLREAILAANASAGGDQITFNIAGPGPHTIQPTTPLPALTGGSTHIQATSQPGWSPSTQTPVVEISGASMPNDEPLLVLGSENNTVDGLAINRGLGVGIFVLAGAHGNIITQNHIGVDVSGTIELGNRYQGIFVASNENTITENVISGNEVNGIWIHGSDGSAGVGNTVSENLIGTNKAGDVAIPNLGSGVRLGEGASNNLLHNNVISGNGVYGVWIEQATENQVVGNIIGLDVDGDSPLGNASLGVVVNGTDNVIGGDDEADRNVISGNLDSGVWSLRERNQVIGNYIGTDATGTLDRGNQFQGVVLSADDNLVDGNLISGNDAHGVWVTADQGTGRLNNISGNRIGTDATGLLPIGNAIHGIILTAGTHNNWIGAAADGFPGSFHTGSYDGNVIGANGGSGIVFEQSNDNIVRGNTIGLGVDGQTELPHPAVGIYVDNSARNRIGTGNSAADVNVVSASGFSGIELFGSGTVDTIIAGNYVGTDRSGTLARGNGTADTFNSTAGVVLGRDTARTQVGWFTDSIDEEFQRNVISGNVVFGVRIIASDDNIVAGNRIGTTADGTAAIGNARGIAIGQMAERNQIGGASDELRNLVSGNRDAGIFVENSRQTTISGNFIGTDVSGTTGLGVQAAGIWLRGGAASNVIGTNGDGINDGTEGNLISGNNIGLRVNNAGSINNMIAGNLIGTDVTGMLAVGNNFSGIVITDSANQNRIGGVTADQRNVISASGNHGISINNAAENQIAGNFIGTDIFGQQDLGNAQTGIRISGGSQANVIGTNGDDHDDQAESNVIANSGQFGISIVGTGTDGNVVAGNTSRDNHFEGISVGSFAANTRIGVSGDGVGDQWEGNVIFGNNSGIRLSDAHGTIIAGNRIGADPNDPTSVGNPITGIAVTGESTMTRVGTNSDGMADAAEANLIHGNGWGVTVGRDIFNSSTGVPSGTTIRGNSISGHAGLGIDLGSDIVVFDGVTPNDIDDVDEGANGLQNFPVLATAVLGQTSAFVQGQLQSRPQQTYTIDFYTNDASNASGHGEGQYRIGTTIVTTDSSGVALIDFEIPTTEAARGWITATATDADGNTSEFSRSLAPDTSPPVSRVDSAGVQRQPGSLVIDVPVVLDTTPITGGVNSDIVAVDLYVSVDGGPFTLDQTLAEAPYAFEFVGESNRTYGFQSIARDLVGNIESKPASIEASIYVPDLTPPQTSVSLMNARSTGFDLRVDGIDTGGSGFQMTDVFVEIDGAAPQQIARFDRSELVNGELSVEFAFNPVGDDQARTYRFYSMGTDRRGNVETVPADADQDVRITHVIDAPTQLGIVDFDVQQGAVQRSYIRTLDVTFNQAGGLADIMASLDDDDPTNDRVRLTRFGNDGTSNPTNVDLAGLLSLGAVDEVLRIDFGVEGIGVGPASTIGDGYYALEFDLDGDSIFDETQNFYRLLGDTNGDRRVDVTDFRNVFAAMGSTGNLDQDIDGNGVVNIQDLLTLRRSLGRSVNLNLPLDD